MMSASVLQITADVACSTPILVASARLKSSASTLTTRVRGSKLPLASATGRSEPKSTMMISARSSGDSAPYDRFDARTLSVGQLRTATIRLTAICRRSTRPAYTDCNLSNADGGWREPIFVIGRAGGECGEVAIHHKPDRPRLRKGRVQQPKIAEPNLVAANVQA